MMQAALRRAVHDLHRLCGSAAVYRTAADQVIACVAMVARRDPIVGLPGAIVDVRAPGYEIRLLQSEVPARPAPGDVLEVAGRTMTVRDVAEDAEQTQWICDCTDS